MKTINSRRTIRRYSQEDVSDDLLRELLSVAERTPTMGNLQLYSVVITRSLEMKKKIAPAHFNQPMVTEAPVVLTFCADYRRTTSWATQRKGIPGYDNFLSFLNAATDALLYCQTFCNLAEERGLGTCLVMPVATITLGWPAETPEQTDRLPLKSIIHNETYNDYTPERIDEFYMQKENLKENKDFVEQNKKETLAQVYTDIRYTKKDNEAMSVGLLEALRQQGFL